MLPLPRGFFRNQNIFKLKNRSSTFYDIILRSHIESENKILFSAS